MRTPAIFINAIKKLKLWDYLKKNSNILKPQFPNGELFSRRRIASLGKTHLSDRFPGFIPLKAEGLYITGIDGNKYIDFTAQRVNVGHGHPRVIQAVKQQIMEGGLLVGELPKIILAEKLKEIVPDELSKGIVGLTRGGTPAVEKAILAIRSYSTSQKSISLTEEDQKMSTQGFFKIRSRFRYYDLLFNLFLRFSPVFVKPHQLPL